MWIHVLNLCLMGHWDHGGLLVCCSAPVSSWSLVFAVGILEGDLWLATAQGGLEAPLTWCLMGLEVHRRVLSWGTTAC